MSVPNHHHLGLLSLSTTDQWTKLGELITIARKLLDETYFRDHPASNLETRFARLNIVPVNPVWQWSVSIHSSRLKVHLLSDKRHHQSLKNAVFPRLVAGWVRVVV